MTARGTLTRMAECHRNIVVWIARILVVIETLFIVEALPIECIWRSSISATLPETQTMSTPVYCHQGQLVWNNPRGSLTASFTQDGQDPFSVCILVPGQNTTLSAIYEERAGSSWPLDVDYDNTPVCVDSVGNTAVLRFDAVEDTSLLTLVDYFIEST